MTTRLNRHTNVDAFDESTTRTSTQRYRRGEIPGQEQQAQQIIHDLARHRVYVQRASRQASTTKTQRASRAEAYQEPRRREVNTHDDADIVIPEEIVQIDPITQRPVMSVMPVPQQKKRRFLPDRRGWHPTVWIGLTVLGMVLFWIGSTNGAAWVSTNLIDPGTYGPAHGQMIHAVFGGGDSQAQPSKVMSVNDNGRVLVIKLTADDPSKAQIIPGPDLSKLDFPDPTGAEIAIQAGDFDHDGHTDLEVTINSTMFNAPLHRYAQTYILYGDGKGNLKARSAQ